jgi:prepilin-type N-terminal cleavage/methylation domain-containing protein
MKKGFTLAEVLITLSVVAVVALMTVPSIIKNYKYKTYAATLKQTIAQLNDAVQTSMLDENATSFIQSTYSLLQ